MILVAWNKKLFTIATRIQKYSRNQVNNMSNTPKSLTVGAIVLVAMTSCSLPPREAWRQIQRDGLIPFVATQWSSDSSPAKQTNGQMIASQPVKKQAPASAQLASTTGNSLIGPPVVTPSSSPTPPSPAMMDDKSIPAAQPVPGLFGYVRTPFTNPPRLVDVRGMSAGSKVVCPFTNKPFLVPGAAVGEPKLAAAPSPVAAPTPAPTVQVTTPVANTAPPLKGPATVAAMSKTQSSPPPSAPPAQPKPQNPSAAASPKPAPISTSPAAKTESQETPFGAPIAGRPGFVNSPYAAKHQLVDVTGLPVGMEVKCPYTGKLFRVPPQDQAQGRVPVQNTASPEKK